MGGSRQAGPLGATRGKPIDRGTLNRQRSPAPKPVGSDHPAVLTHRWVDAATYHRTFVTVEAAARVYHWDLADMYLEVDTGIITPFRDEWIQAYEVDVSARSFALTWMVEKPDQDFARYATPFERQRGIPVKGHLGSAYTVPVVVRTGDNFLVVGYVATVRGDHLFVPQGFLGNYTLLGKVLEKGVPVFVREGEAAEDLSPFWRRWGLSEFQYTVSTRVDGGVTQYLSSRATGFVESEFGPILLIATALAPLGQGLVRGIISSLFRRESGAIAGDLVLDGMTEELAQGVTAEATTSRTMAQALRAEGKEVVVNVGGEASPFEVSRWPNAINVNPVKAGRPVDIPNLVKAGGEELGSLFESQSVDKIVSSKLPTSVDPELLARGAAHALRSGGQLEINIFGAGVKEWSAKFTETLIKNGFDAKNLKNISDVLIQAVK